jgi:hypothetical protein
LRLQRDAKAETFQATDEVSRQVLLTEFVQIEVSQVIVGNLLVQHMVDGHQNLVRHRNDSSLGIAPGFDAVELVAQVGLSFTTACRRVILEREGF